MLTANQNIFNNNVQTLSVILEQITKFESWKSQALFLKFETDLVWVSVTTCETQISKVLVSNHETCHQKYQYQVLRYEIKSLSLSLKVETSICKVSVLVRSNQLKWA